MYISPATSFQSLDEVQIWAIETLFNCGSEVAPLGVETLEAIAASFSIANPRRRCITNPLRKWSLPLA
jgi:hypothetical protein